MSNPQQANAARDAASLRLLGMFFCILGGLVLIGSAWSLDNLRGLLVSIGGGLVLTAVGGGMLRAARRVRSASTGKNSTEKK